MTMQLVNDPNTEPSDFSNTSVAVEVQLPDHLFSSYSSH
jgi:hypothetical protein